MPSVNKRYVVKLAADERHALEAIVGKGTVAAQKRRHATILLGVDEGEHGPALSDGEVAESTGVTKRTVERTRERCVNDGLELALQRKPRTRERAPRLDGEAEARLTVGVLGLEFAVARTIAAVGLGLSDRHAEVAPGQGSATSHRASTRSDQGSSGTLGSGDRPASASGSIFFR